MPRRSGGGGGGVFDHEAKTLHFRRENVVLGQKVIKYNIFEMIRSLNVRNCVKIDSKIKICRAFFKKYTGNY